MPSATATPFRIRLEKEPLPSAHLHYLASIALQTDAHPDTIKTNLNPLRHIKLFENWYAEQSTRGEECGRLSYRYNDDILFGHTPLNQRRITQDLREAYKDLVQLLASKQFALLRIWHYLPQLAEAADYQVFCDARARAFSTFGSDSYCAATVIGNNSEDGVVYFIAAREAGIAIDNPRQTVPYLYPKYYVEPSPMFARATLKQWSRGNSHLYISGTAAIVGHESLHKDNADAQLEELLCNLGTLLCEASKVEQSYSGIKLHQLRHAKLYVDARVAGDIAALVDKHLSAQEQLQIFVGQICRPELLVEMEAMVMSDYHCGDDARTP